MKILHVCPLYYPSVGGNQNHVQFFSEGLSKLGEEVSVFTANSIDNRDFDSGEAPKKLLPGKELVNGVDVQRFPIHRRLYRFIFKDFVKTRVGYSLTKSTLKNSFDFWQTGPLVLDMLPAIRRLKPDIMMNIMNYFFTTLVCYEARKKYSIPFLMMPIIHTADKRSHHPFLKEVFKTADRLIACTEFEKRFLVHQGVKENKVSVLPLGISCEEVTSEDGKNFRKKYNINEGPVVAYVGRKVKLKGIECLIDAMKMVWEEVPEAKLLLAGQIVERFVPILNKHLDSLTAEEKKRVIQIDNFSEEEKKDLFATIDVLVFASNIDCFGIVILEAWAGAKPVIVCKNTPQETIVEDGKDGLLVEYDNRKGMSEAITRLLKDKNLREEMGERGRIKCLKKHNLDDYVVSLREEYRKILNPNFALETRLG